MSENASTTTTWKPLSTSIKGRLDKLRAATPTGAIVYVPQKACPDCADLYKPCENHALLKTCRNCKNHNITEAHQDVPGISHPFVESLFFQTDPAYVIEYIGLDPNGSPVVAFNGEGRNKMANIRGKITVCGITRSAVGTVEANTKFLYKELDSDLIKNLGRRFGIAADLKGLPKRWAEGIKVPATKAAAKTQVDTKTTATVERALVEKTVAAIKATKTAAELQKIGVELQKQENVNLRSVALVNAAFKARANDFTKAREDKAAAAAVAAETKAVLVALDEAKLEGKDEPAAKTPSPRRRKSTKAAA